MVWKAVTKNKIKNFCIKDAKGDGSTVIDCTCELDQTETRKNFSCMIRTDSGTEIITFTCDKEKNTCFMKSSKRRRIISFNEIQTLG